MIAARRQDAEPGGARPAQDCARCRQQTLCWFRESRPAQVAVTLAVCRLQQAKTPRERDRAFRALLEMVGAKLRKSAEWCAKRVGRDPDTAYLDLQAAVYEKLTTKFDIAAGVHPLHWLFNPRTGAVTLWVANETERLKRQRTRYVVTDPESIPQLPNTPTVDLREPPTEARLPPAVYDGTTLTVREFRAVVGLTMEGMTLAKMAARLALSGPQLTKVYGNALAKLAPT